MINNITEKITELTGIWYSLLIDHHKDRDCHFFISRKENFFHWKYGEKPSIIGNGKYIVEHYGYVGQEIEEYFDTCQEAQEFLYHKLIKMITFENNMWLMLCDDTSNDDQKFALKHKQLFLDTKEKLNEYKTN